MGEKRTCKTCTYFNESAYYCRKIEDAVAEWDSCKGHITFEELQAKALKARKNIRCLTCGAHIGGLYASRIETADGKLVGHLCIECTREVSAKNQGERTQ